MRVAMYYSNRDVRLEELERPKAGPGECVMKIHASGICGSDVMEWYRIGKTPLVLGHEIAGEVAEVGEGVEKFKPGQRIVAAHHVPCHTCHYCLSGHETVCDTLRSTKFYPGGFSEYVRLPAINVDRGIFPLPDSISYEEGTFVEPLGCVYRGQRLSNMSTGKSVLVLGSGISGLLHIKLARALGASFIMATDIDGYRMERAREAGADRVLPATDDIPRAFRESSGHGRGADLVILTTGALPAIEQAVESVERGGTVLFFAPTDEGVKVPMDLNRIFWRNEVTLTSSYAANHADHVTATELIRQGKVEVKSLITHRLPLKDTQEGFALVVKGSDSVKVIIEPQR